MISFEALFKIAYGLYIVSSGDRTKGNGYISNTFFQVTSDPPQFAACCHKDNYTAGLISQAGAFAVSVLRQEASPELIGTFGYMTGRDVDKMKNVKVKYGDTGVPVVITDALAVLECRVTRTIDVGTHLMFIGDLVEAEILDDVHEPLTYAWYRKVKKGLSPKNAPTYIDKSRLETPAEKPGGKKYKCSICGYIYDEATEAEPFDALPSDYVCPVCGASASEFIEIES